MDEDIDDPAYWSSTSRGCDLCGETIPYMDEVFLIQVCTAQMTEDGLECVPLVHDNEFAFSPYLLHFSCWETIYSDMQELTQDVPPRDAKDPVLICTLCESLIGATEAFVSVTFAELHVSRRSPSGSHTDTVAPMGAPDPVCLECMAHAISDELSAWEEVLYYMPTGYLDEEDLHHGL